MVDDTERQYPRGCIRALHFFVAVSVVFFLHSVSNVLLKPQTELSYVALLSLLFFASVLSWSTSRDIWRLHARRWPRWGEYLSYGVAFGLLGALILLREFRVIVWSDHYLNATFIWCSVPIAIAAWCTERRKKVHVYVCARGLHFVSTNAP